MARECAYQRHGSLAVEILNDGTFIQDHGAELSSVQRVHSVVIADIDTFSGFVLVANDTRGISPANCFLLNLSRHGQRRQDQRAAIRLRRGMHSPLQFAGGLAESGRKKQSSGTSTKRELHAVLLKREQMGLQDRHRIETARTRRYGFGVDEVLIGVA